MIQLKEKYQNPPGLISFIYSEMDSDIKEAFRIRHHEQMEELFTNHILRRRLSLLIRKLEEGIYAEYEYKLNFMNPDPILKKRFQILKSTLESLLHPLYCYFK